MQRERQTERDTQSLYTHAHAVNQQWCLNRRQLQVSASQKWQLPWWQWQWNFKHFSDGSEIKEREMERDRERERESTKMFRNKRQDLNDLDWTTRHSESNIQSKITPNPELEHTFTADILLTYRVTLHGVHNSDQWPFSVSAVNLFKSSIQMYA